MAGQPLKRACHVALDAREEEVFDRLAAGEYVTAICEDVLTTPYEEAGKDEPNSYHFYTWLDAAKGRRDRFERVRRSAADAVAEESVRLLDEAREEGVNSTAEATLARSQSSARQWWASKLNRERFGDGNRPGVDVNLHIGQLHLEALLEAGHCHRSEKHGELEAAGTTLPEDREPPNVIEGEYEYEEGTDGATS